MTVEKSYLVPFENIDAMALDFKMAGVDGNEVAAVSVQPPAGKGEYSEIPVKTFDRRIHKMFAHPIVR